MEKSTWQFLTCMLGIIAFVLGVAFLTAWEKCDEFQASQNRMKTIVELQASLINKKDEHIAQLKEIQAMDDELRSAVVGYLAKLRKGVR